MGVAAGTPSGEDAPQLWVITRSRVFSRDNRWTWGIGLFRDLERDDEVVVGGGDGGGAGGGGAQEETRGNLRTILLQVAKMSGGSQPADLNHIWGQAWRTRHYGPADPQEMHRT